MGEWPAGARGPLVSGGHLHRTWEGAGVGIDDYGVDLL